MGWTVYYDRPSNIREWAIARMEEMKDSEGNQLYRVLDYAATLTTQVMAIECLTDFPYGKGNVFATTDLIAYYRNGEFGIKDMSESMGTGIMCPLRILDKLSPIEDLYGPILSEQVCDNHYNCANSGPEYEGKITTWNLPHVNQRTVEDGSAAWAKRWREQVRAYHAKRAAKPKVSKGSKVRFEQPIKFTNGQELTEFEFVRGSSFRAGYTLYRITGWRDMQYEVAA